MNVIYNVIIQPLVLIYELLYVFLSRGFRNPISVIICMSVIINFVVLPLYNKADQLQTNERNKQAAMAARIQHIKKCFHGDEQFMMLQAYYRIEHYSPFSFLNEVIPLALQIPFFIAAYQFISSLPYLKGTSLGPIQDLSLPDGLLTIGSFSVNLLPILMTVINLISGMLYSKGNANRLKTQLIVTALLFLVLLYNSPSGLVLYWTMNNLFSLGKNIVLSIQKKKRKTVIAWIYLGLFALLLYAVLVNVFSVILMVIAVLLVYAAFNLKYKGEAYDEATQSPFHQLRILLTCSQCKVLFRHVLPAELGLWILMGLYIPSSVLSSSVFEFWNQFTREFEYHLLYYPAQIYFGLFLIWLSVIFFSIRKKARWVFAVILYGVLAVAMINQFAFQTKTGSLYTDLTFDGVLEYPGAFLIMNILACLAGVLFIVWMHVKHPVILRQFLLILCIALTGMSGYHLMIIRSSIQNIEPGLQYSNSDSSYDGVLTLSKHGKNVIVFMLDRAIGGYVPYIFDENPELKNSFDGFVYYPNTVSFGVSTNYGAPALFGGYEYTPEAMNKRDKEMLEDKHHEALKMMPVLFSESGYQVVVADPPYAGYKYGITDLSIFDDHPEIQTYILEGVYADQYSHSTNLDSFETQKRNFIMYSLFRSVPVNLKSTVYDHGNYLSLHGQGYSRDFYNAYSELSQLNRLTGISEGSEDHFLMLVNTLPHNPTSLNPYRHATVVSKTLDGMSISFHNQSDWAHYDVNVLTYQKLADWLEHLKQQGVYDNTRIIFVSDHGYFLEQFDALTNDSGLDVEAFWPLLMVKDFNDREPWTIDQTFMTNADVPSLAVKGLFEEAVNPFTDVIISDNAKTEAPMHLTDSRHAYVDENNGYTFDTSDAPWWSVHDDIFDMNNWEKYEPEEAG